MLDNIKLFVFDLGGTLMEYNWTGIYRHKCYGNIRSNSDINKAAVWSDIQALEISEEDFYKAVKVCTVLRSKE